MRHSVHSIFYDQAEAHEAAGRYDSALELLYQLHRWVPDDPNYWLRLGLLSLQMTAPGWLREHGRDSSHVGDMALLNADVYLERAASLGVSDPTPLLWRAWLHQQRLGNFTLAESLLGSALKRNPRWPYALAALGRLELARAEPGYPLRALRWLNEAAHVLPESARLHYDRGVALVACENFFDAREAFQTAVRTPSLSASRDLLTTMLTEEFHGHAPHLRELVARYYPSVYRAMEST
ncbi:MAG: tetratricopeptide repeat protein [Candidatus Sericytochromatia bacterium]|nr:tetratricopeptide repeat protein [Candidatus Sericytochromatia bacterium]